MIYTAFVRPRLDYGDILYNQAFNLSFQQKLESIIQNRACLRITGAIRGTSREKIYQELGLESLQSRRWYRKLAMFYKIYKNKSPFYLFNLIPEKTSSYATRNVDCISLIKIKHNFFKNTFFPSAIIEWNKLDLAIRNAESLGIFKSNILKFFRPTPRSFFNCYNHKGIRLMTRPLGEWAVYVNINSITIFKTVLILFAIVIWISNQRLTFFSTVPYLVIKESLSWALLETNERSVK